MKKIYYNYLRENYEQVLTTCKLSGEAFILTDGSKCDLVIMHNDSYVKREQTLSAQALVLESYANRLAGGKEYSLKESKELIDEMVSNN